MATHTASSAVLEAPATLDDLLRYDGKAELIGGTIVSIMPTGYLPGRIAGKLFRSIDDWCTVNGVGVALGDGVGYAIPQLLNGRQSFSPDVSFYNGPLPASSMRFIEGPPTLAVDVRSESDYTAAAASEMARKRADYFTAGTLVVWDVDPVAQTVLSFHRDRPTVAQLFAPEDTANAEPALPGWRLSLPELFAGLPGA